MPADALTLLPAALSDYETLARIGHDAFHPDKLRFGQGPRVYEEPQFMRALLADNVDTVHKLVAGGQTVGFALSFPREAGYRWLGCLAIAPAWQNRGYGARAIALLEEAFPAVRRWGLDTPAAKADNRRFYERAGFVPVGQSEPYAGFTLIVFEKRLAGA
jgi:GNAT superfamily N-acetyltransferase